MMIKKVVVAAAGQGTRMMELTNDKSKHLIEVGNKPFLFYLVNNLFKSGFEEIILVVGFKAELMDEFVKKYFPDKKITILNQHEILGPKEKEYGTACPIKCVKDIINEPFLFVSGDHFYSERDLRDLAESSDEFNYASGLENDNPERYGVLMQEDGLLKQIVEKPKEFVGNLVNITLYKFNPEIFDKVMQIEKSPRGEYEITDAVNLLAKEGKVKVNAIKDKEYWIDFGKPEDVKTFSNFVKNGSYQKVTKSSN